MLTHAELSKYTLVIVAIISLARYTRIANKKTTARFPDLRLLL